MPDLYGFTPTHAGRVLLASLLAGQTLTITRAMVGSGKPDSLEAMAALTDLVTPEARATSTTPVRTGDAVSLTVEYRSDMNGGLQEGFFIQEYGLFARTEESPETLIFYGCLGDHPQWVYPYTEGVAPDIRDYPVTIRISSEVNVQISFHADAFITAEEAAALLESMVQQAAGAAVLDFTIPADGWDQQEGQDFSCTLQVTVPEARASHYPVVTVHPDSLEAAFQAGLCPAVRAEEGALRFWARNPPGQELEATVLLQPRLGSSTGTSGDGSMLPPATRTTLGGVMVGDNLSITPDGRLSAEKVPETATSAEMKAALDEVFQTE